MLLIDVSNVLHTTGVLPEHLAGIDVPELAKLISTSRYARRRAVLVCDGVGPADRAKQEAPPGGGGTGAAISTNTAPSGKEIAGLDVVYAGRDQEADDVIELLIARDSAPRRLVVVSTDRRLARAARRRRAQSLTSDAFLRHLASDSEKRVAKALPGFATQVPLNEYAVGYWMGLFGYGSMDSEPPPGERPVPDVSAAALRGVQAEQAKARDRKRAASPHAHERLKVPKQLLDAGGAASSSANPKAPSKPTPPPAEPPRPAQPAADELPADVRELLKDSGLHLDPADLDMSTWLPKDDNPPSD